MDKIKIGDLVTLKEGINANFNIHPIPPEGERIDFFANEIYLYLGPIAMDYGNEEIYFCDKVLFNEKLYAIGCGNLVKAELDGP